MLLRSGARCDLHMTQTETEHKKLIDSDRSVMHIGKIGFSKI